MKTVLALAAFFVLLSGAAYVVAPVSSDVCDQGVCVVEFNADFNSSNSVSWIETLSDCVTSRVDISSNPDLQKKHKIVVVPTIVIFNDGSEVTRFQANIMMTMEATKDDVQSAIDDALMSDF